MQEVPDDEDATGSLRGIPWVARDSSMPVRSYSAQHHTMVHM